MGYRIRHVLPVVGHTAAPDLQRAQRLTLETVHRAVAYSRITQPTTSVEVVAARFAGEDLPAPWLVDVSPLTRTVLDLVDLSPPRHLPLLSDVLDRLGTADDYDVGIFTNIDIALQPYFYELVVSLLDAGTDGFVINRRTVHPAFRAVSTAELMAQVGSVHPGQDCFVFSSSAASRFRVHDVCLGAPHVARTLLWNVAAESERFREFTDLHATFHLGDDRAWRATSLTGYASHNGRQALLACADLVRRHGRDRVGALPAVGPYLAALDRAVLPRNPGSVGPVPTRSAPRSTSRQRLVFAVHPGRCGSEYLATLLGHVPGVKAHHEAPPRMIGPHLRSVVHRGPAASYSARTQKAERIRAELATASGRAVYVDTSHMFIKTMADVILDAFNHDQLTVLRIHRSPADLLRSFLELGWFSSRSLQWSEWMHIPVSEHCPFRLPVDETLDESDLVLGYLADVEARSRVILAAAPSVEVVDIDFGSMVTAPGSIRLLDRLQLDELSAARSFAGTRVNDKRPQKDRIGRHIDPSWCVDRVGEFRDRFSVPLERAGLEDLWADLAG